MNLSYLIQAEFSTPLQQKSSPSRRLWWHALIKELSWPQLVSSTWPGRVGWMSVTLAGWETGASATPSTFVDHSVEGVCWGCELFTSTQTRRDTHFLNPATTPSATQVGHHLDKEWRYWKHCSAHYHIHWYFHKSEILTPRDWTLMVKGCTVKFGRKECAFWGSSQQQRGFCWETQLPLNEHPNTES